MKIRVVVDENVCIGSGSCMVASSDHFELNSQGKAEVKSSNAKGKEVTLEVTGVKIKEILQAAGACPTQAITVFDEKGKKIYPH